MTDRIPRIGRRDSSAALLREGYTFGAHRFLETGSDAFETRLMLRPAVIAYGTEAARLLYETDRMTRRRALPPTTLTLLQDFRSVELLDEQPHRHRKAMFLSLMTPAAVAELADLVEGEWRAGIDRWAGSRDVVLFDAVREVLCRAVCAWAGVPLHPDDVAIRTRQFAAMVEGAGSVGPRNLRGQVLRHRAERWAGEVVERVRAGELRVDEGRAARVVAEHRDEHGRLLDAETARVELLNVLRPTVAISRYVVFAALALLQHPVARSRVAEDDEYLRWFVQEVRRSAPFFPMVGGRVREEFDWRGRHFARGSWFLLDIYATNHDSRIWDEPAAFLPERFAGWDGGPYDFVPQGGGEFDAGHRCAGEWLTITLVERAVRLLTTAMAYDVPLQDLSVDLSRMPAAPASGVRLSGVRPAA
ncbi:cytochrome P450 [Blastococcus xanthinilyticus]|uniref:Fatty-acid peroxygenase n=1 Tax=Blastococcus xanthinilyticus TaxID=1564164 RepID=A0A5S5CZS6_9ACTN|nr:cytochrome P450 [Blastococcus xanthinilyticus]TYP88584.1 fatty-acid peroxygenase [Blastococcus xanthinilyticus]